MIGNMGTSGDFDPDETFYEEDRPLEEVLAAYERGVKGVTARPNRIELTVTPQVYMPVPPSRAWLTSVTYEPAMPEPIRVATARV
jgi:hypothetical protein